MKPHVRMEYSRITPYIYIGTNMCCNLHFQKLVRLEVEADIDLEYSRSDREPADFVKTFLWLPTRDHFAPTQKQLLVGTAALQALVRQRIKTYVHCRFGHGRSPTLVAAYFIVCGLDSNEAIKYIMNRRLEVHLLPRQKIALKKFYTFINK